MAKMLENLREGDTVIFWKLDRFGWSLKELIALIDVMHKKGVVFISLKDSTDTSTAQGRLILHIFASLAVFEKGIIRERTNARLSAAKACGRTVGRKKGLTPESIKKVETAA